MKRTLCLAACLPVLALLTGCVYFNTFFNAEKAYAQALRMREKRIDKNPEDSILATPEEKLKLERSIAKSSKVLELFPDKKKYQPKAIFLIGESYLAMGEYAKAIQKYDELKRFYPAAEEMRVAEFHRAKSLFLNGQYPFARTALEKVIAGTDNPEFRREAMIYLAQLEVKNNSPQAALDLYERLLKEQAHSPLARANVHFEAARLAFELGRWEQARGHAKAEEIGKLPSRLRYRCDMLSAECLYRLGKVPEGIGELEAMLGIRLYAVFIPEIDLKLAEGRFLLNQPEKAVALLKQVPVRAPKSALSAEAFYRLGEYYLQKLRDEKQAKAFYDSAAAAGSSFRYAILALERSQALARLSELRKAPGQDTAADKAHYRDFMIAELFLFRLDNLDSALVRLDRIVGDTRQDTAFSIRAAYARAFIQEEFKKSKPVSDSLYRYVLDRYPNTEYAKQAERNLGLKPTVQTDEDEAHKLFLAAEAVRFGGSNVVAEAIPAYRKVVAGFPATREAAKAQFVIAMLFDQMIHGEEKVAGSLDSAKVAYSVLRDRYPQSPYFSIAAAKLDAAGVKAAPAAPSRASPSQPGDPRDPRRHPRSVSPTESTAAPPDTSFTPEDKPREELETDYDKVDQY